MGENVSSESSDEPSSFQHVHLGGADLAPPSGKRGTFSLLSPSCVLLFFTSVFSSGNSFLITAVEGHTVTAQILLFFLSSSRVSSGFFFSVSSFID